MKMVLISSAHGGSAKTTTAVRLAEKLKTLGLRTLVVDISPFPTAALMKRDGDLAVVAGSSITSHVGAESLLRGYQGKVDLVILDSGSISDPNVNLWLPQVDGLLFTTRPSKLALLAIPGTYDALDRFRALNSKMELLGFLPTMVTGSDTRELNALRVALKDKLINIPQPLCAHEKRRAQECAFTGLDEMPLAQKDFASEAIKQLGNFFCQKYNLVPQVQQAEEPKQVGVLTRFWKLAADKFRNGKQPGGEVSAS